MTTYTVTTPGELQQRLDTAMAGDLIVIAAGFAGMPSGVVNVDGLTVRSDLALGSLVVLSLGVMVDDLSLTGTGPILVAGNGFDNDIGPAVTQFADAPWFLAGGDGKDTLEGNGYFDPRLEIGDVFQGGQGNDVLIGGGGFDSADYATSPAGVVVDLKAGTAADGFGGTDTLVGISFAIGSAHDDVLIARSLAGEDPGFSVHLRGGGGNDTLQGDSGLDTADYASSTAKVTVDLAAGTASDGFGGTDTLISIENASGGSAADALTGNGGANQLLGGLGNDTLTGGAGNDRLDVAPLSQGGELPPQLLHAEGWDTLAGGRGDDWYGVDDGKDEIVEKPGEGRDTVYTTLRDYTLPDNVEDLVFRHQDLTLTEAALFVRGVGNALGNQIVGGAGADTLIGLGGDDVLVGNFMPSNAADRLEGGAGNDQYEVDLLTDRIVEKAGEGIDTVRVTIGAAPGGAGAAISNHYSLSDAANPGLAAVENLVAGGAFSFFGEPSFGMDLTGNALDNMIVGAAKGDVLKGLVGNDRLIGGAGADVMAGGKGDDYYDVENAGDVVSESGDAKKSAGQIGGRDTIATPFASFSLAATAALQPVENLTARPQEILNDAGAIVKYTESARSFVGNGLANDIVGGLFGDLLRGAAGDDYLIGGPGNDTLDGGVGNDDYDIDSKADIVREGGGHDTIATSLRSFRLGGSARNPGLEKIEDLIFKGAQVVKVAADLEAGQLPTVVFDRKAAFVGTGNERDNAIVGADGNDTLRGRGGDDSLVGLKGNDRLEGGNGADALFGVRGDDRLYGGAGDDRLEGSYGADKLYGGAGADRLRGGVGSDTLSGGGGADLFVFDAALGPDNVDRIADFNPRADTIRLEDYYFRGIARGTLADDALHIGSAAADANDRIVYDRTTGALSYDSDGSGAAAPIRFAVLSKSLALTAADFAIV